MINRLIGIEHSVVGAVSVILIKPFDPLGIVSSVLLTLQIVGVSEKILNVSLYCSFLNSNFLFDCSLGLTKIGSL